MGYFLLSVDFKGLGRIRYWSVVALLLHRGGMSATMRGTARATLTVAGMLLLFCGGLVAQDDLADYPIKEEQCENFGCAPQPLSTTDAPARANSAPSTGGQRRLRRPPAPLLRSEAICMGNNAACENVAPAMRRTALCGSFLPVAW